MDLHDAEAGGSFAAWFWLANVAIDLRLTEPPATVGQATRNLPRVLNNNKIRKQNPAVDLN